MQKFHSFYNLDFGTVLEALDTTTSGLTHTEAKKRQEEFGKNEFQEQKKRGVMRVFFSHFFNPLIFILLFASGITIYLQEVVETIVIWLAIFVNLFFSTYQEYRAENAIDQLKKLIKNRALVLRGGQSEEIDSSELTVGDIVLIQYGSRVPADIRLIEAHDLKVDESMITGESLPVSKHTDIVTNEVLSDRKNYVLSGTLVTNGNGVGVVTHIGAQTEIGKIAESISNTKKVLTPVQTAVKNISWYIFFIALGIVFFIFLLGLFRGEDFYDMLVLASAVAVGAVPEALPIALAMILAIGVLTISKKGGLIRKLVATETLGSTTLVLTDKTGTLTEGNLQLENILLWKKDGFEANDFSRDKKLHPDQEMVLIQASQNFSRTSTNAFEVILNKTLQTCDARELPIHAKIITPFNSTNKYSVSQNHDIYTVVGAPDILVQNASLSDQEKEYALERIQTLSTQGKRLIAVAEKKTKDSFQLQELTILGVFVLSDILRKDIKKQISEITAHGISVKIITGDLPGTALYIAHQVGLHVLEQQILTGAQLRELTDEELLQIIPEIKVFARVTPEDKLRIGKLYQQLGEIVAMTGDGVNDSPALKAMDIGIALSSGSEVAKSAADMILLRDDFKTIVETITVGRSIKKNIQKVFVYLMSNSLDSVFVVTGSLIVGLALPITALQIIWVNILTGTLPALAFAYDKTKDVRSVTKDIFNRKVKVLALGIGTISSFFLFILHYALSKNIDDGAVAQAVFFLCFAVYILIIAYSFRDLDKYIWQYNPFSNWRLNAGVVFGLVFIVATVYTSVGQQIFSLVAVPYEYLWILFAWLFFNVWIVEFAKFLFRK